jgi:hypothetical protein
MGFIWTINKQCSGNYNKNHITKPYKETLVNDINNKKEKDHQPLIQTRNWIYPREELEHFDSKLLRKVVTKGDYL